MQHPADGVQLCGAEDVPVGAGAGVHHRAAPAVRQRAARAVPAPAQAGLPQGAQAEVRAPRRLWWLKLL